MKLNQIINLHKGLTAFVVVGLMILFDNFTIAPYVYLALHGTYGLLWLLKEKIFPDPYFKEKINLVGMDELQIPAGRSEKLINTVEASTRLDAIASAGFRVSRTKIIERIENGMLRLNGSKVNKPTINLKIGDKLELENKGFIEILNLEITKRERWKVKLLRK